VSTECIDIIHSLRQEKQENSSESMQTMHVWIILGLIIPSCHIDSRRLYVNQDEECMREFVRVVAHHWCGAEPIALASCIEGAQTSKVDVGGKIGVISSFTLRREVAL